MKGEYVADSLSRTLRSLVPLMLQIDARNRGVEQQKRESQLADEDRQFRTSSLMANLLGSGNFQPATPENLRPNDAPISGSMDSSGIIRGVQSSVERNPTSYAPKVSIGDQMLAYTPQAKTPMATVTRGGISTQVPLDQATATYGRLPGEPIKPLTANISRGGVSVQDVPLNRLGEVQGVLPAEKPEGMTPYETEQIKIANARLKLDENKANTPAELPPAMRSDVAKNDALISDIKNARAALNLNRSAIGFFKGQVPDEILQRIDPSGVGARAAVANVASQIRLAIAGANVTKSEAANIRPFIVNDTDDPDAALQKLDKLAEWVERRNQALKGQPIGPVAPSNAGPKADGFVNQLRQEGIIR